MSDQNDISMLDVSNALDSISNESQQPPQRRKLTLILTDEPDLEQMHVESPKPAETPDSHGSLLEPGVTHAAPVPEQPVAAQPVPEQEINVPVDITWLQGGDKVYVTGSFTGWRKMIGLQKQADNTHVVTLGLPVGTHRFRFVIDNELRFSDFLPTATDQMGNFVNYVEVTPEHVQMHLRQQLKFEEEQQQQREQEARKMLQKTAQNSQNSLRNRSLQGRPRSDSIFKFISDDDDMGNGYLRYYDDDDVESSTDSRSLNYINDIPPIFVEPKVMEQYYMAIDDQAKSQNGPQQAWLHPPQLPPQLDNVILNNFNSMDRHNNSGALPIPNHVVLNHLATTSIKHNTLAVASVVRYKRKYVTQVLYAPLQGLS
ncbi:5'-AMP-activated protein kinase beta subunit, interaction domain [Metschnikowia aff. pulcherrima]|uniref:5'-AMP-activated protein kinase beta subunit, interaction domain n=1 Tax=Metschnikowia aff. pulcherrima TaxID=2163413 RepID=A0A4V1AE44_9ASCO|nr:5'-AMP-activated protein kinase beta subunit, interaction domain [Metschnikowia aff. pulcherrima]